MPPQKWPSTTLNLGDPKKCTHKTPSSSPPSDV
jgi:hypothetical protein